MLNVRSERLLARLKALADPVRLRLLALCQHGECSVSELTGVLGLSQPRVSQQLKLLCNAALLERFRDGQRVYYRLPPGSDDAGRRQLLALLPPDEPQFAADAGRLRELRSEGIGRNGDEVAVTPEDRALHRAFLDLTVAAPVGDLLDIGCGRGQLLKLLASRANRAVGVDIDAGARNRARAELLLAGFENCSLRQGDMYRLPFDDAQFDTIIVDDVLADAAHPSEALAEAGRLLRPGGRLFVLLSLEREPADAAQQRLAAWCRAARLRLAPPRVAPRQVPRWLLAVASLHDAAPAAA